MHSISLFFYFLASKRIGWELSGCWRGSEGRGIGSESYGVYRERERYRYYWGGYTVLVTKDERHASYITQGRLEKSLLNIYPESHSFIARYRNWIFVLHMSWYVFYALCFLNSKWFNHFWVPLPHKKLEVVGQIKCWTLIRKCYLYPEPFFT